MQTILSEISENNEQTKDETEHPEELCEPGYFTGPAIAPDTNHNCLDINECLFVDLYKCPDNSNCINTVGSFTCTCEQGYYSMDDKCLNVNECNNENACPENSDCVNTDGSYTCSCHKGFVGLIEEETLRKCYNIDECRETPNVCELDSGATCVDTYGGFECSCPEHMLGTGYSGSPCVKEVVYACTLKKRLKGRNYVSGPYT